MSDRETLKIRLDNHEEISVSTLDIYKRLLFYFAFMLNVVFFGVLYLTINVPNFLAPLFIVWILVSFFFLKRQYGYLSSATIKGDILLLTNTSGTNAITYINSIRNISKTNFLNNSITSIKYGIDGKTKKACFISNRNTKNQPSFIIRFAKQYYKNKRQIYKPGSVF
ncbi:MAG: hypothetical protein RL265_491 [Bacteroidota bacterium]|jgi:hypothetical protein